MQGKSWYFRRKGRVEGPFSLAQLQNRVGTNPEYAVWNSKLASWKPAGDWLQNFHDETQMKSKATESDVTASDTRPTVSHSIESKADSSNSAKQSSDERQAPKLVSSRSNSSLVADKAQASRYSHTAAELRVFREKWAALEKKQLAERQQLLQEFSDLKEQISSIKRASIESTLAQMKSDDEPAEKNAVAENKAGPAKTQQRPQTILKSQNLTVKNSPNRDQLSTMSLELVDDDRFAVHRMNDNNDAQEKIYPWPTEQVKQPGAKQQKAESSSLRKQAEAVGKPADNAAQEKISSGNTNSKLDDQVSDIEMMRRVVARRRRRRAR